MGKLEEVLEMMKVNELLGKKEDRKTTEIRFSGSLQLSVRLRRLPALHMRYTVT